MDFVYEDLFSPEIGEVKELLGPLRDGEFNQYAIINSQVQEILKKLNSSGLWKRLPNKYDFLSHKSVDGQKLLAKVYANPRGMLEFELLETPYKRERDLTRPKRLKMSSVESTIIALADRGHTEQAEKLALLYFYGPDYGLGRQPSWSGQPGFGRGWDFGDPYYPGDYGYFRNTDSMFPPGKGLLDEEDLDEEESEHEPASKPAPKKEKSIDTKVKSLEESLRQRGFEQAADKLKTLFNK